MIADDVQLQQAVEQIGRMQRALAYLCETALPASRQQFALMAEGPLDEIRRLEEEIYAYAQPASAESTESEAA